MLRRLPQAMSILAVFVMALMLARDTQAGPVATTIFIVDITEDAPHTNGCGDDTPGNCSLRQAITEANGPSVSFAEIRFNIPPGGPQTITTLSQLPSIMSETLIDGTTQPTTAACGGTTNPPCIRLQGSGTQGGQDGLVINGNTPNVTIKNLAIVGYVSGIRVASGHSDAIVGNYLGTSDGTIATPNQYGVYVESTSTQITIGGTNAADRNVISGNAIGIQTDGDANTIEGNYVGTNAAGTASLTNTGGGIFDKEGSDSNQIENNLISGNGILDDPGIYLIGSFNNVFGNLMGTNAAGTAAVPNKGAGLQLAGSDNQIGGPGSQRNVISGNGLNGIYIVSNPFRNSIDSNYIGLNKAGTAAVPNMGDGILGYFSGLEFFQNNEITRNVISGNKANGIYFQLFSLGVVSLNTIAENTIGRNAANTNAIPNTGDGIRMEASDSMIANNRIGKDGQLGGNVIRNNGGNGIYIDGGDTGDSDGNEFPENSIDDNGLLGIALVGGSNNALGAPVITSATSDANETHVQGTLSDSPGDLEFFASPQCDASGFGEGRELIYSFSVPSGAAFDVVIPHGEQGKAMTVTETDPANDTTEFSNCVAIPVPATPTPTPSRTPSPTPTTSPTRSPTPSPTGSTPVVKGDSDCDGDVDPDDAIADLTEVAGVPPGAPCAENADSNCNGIIDADDALRALAFYAGAPLPQPSGCPSLG